MENMCLFREAGAPGGMGGGGEIEVVRCFFLFLFFA